MISAVTLSTILVISTAARDLNTVLRAEVTCCSLHSNSQSDCEAELGSNCKWIADTNPIALEHGSQCVGTSFYTCKSDDIDACCTGCCDCDANPVTVFPPKIVHPPEAPAGPICSTAPVSVSNAQGLPVSVAKDINDARDQPCYTSQKNPKTDCFVNYNDPNNDNNQGQDYDYSTVTMTFNGVEARDGNCCYKYSSNWGNDRQNCEGDSPAQSHLMFDVDCNEQYYSVKSGATDWASDGSTCYYGIKIDAECPKYEQCDYEICIHFTNLDANVCEWTTSWVMEKAGHAFSFNSLNGIPTCNIVPGSGRSRRVQYVQSVINGVGSHVFGVSNAWLFVVFMAIVLVGLGYYKFCMGDKDGKYERINDNECKGYSTFSSV